MLDNANVDATKGQGYEAKPKWPLDYSIPSVYANQFAITRTGREYVIEFGEFLPTGFANRSEAEILDHLEKATIKPVARIIVSPDGLKAFFNMLDGYMKHPAISNQDDSDE